MVYLAKVDSALTTTVTGLKWFKIYEDGLDSNGTWAVTRLYNNKGKVEFTLPKCIQSGQYVGSSHSYSSVVSLCTPLTIPDTSSAQKSSRSMLLPAILALSYIWNAHRLM